MELSHPTLLSNQTHS
uniref:Uncharacterized protein n=1 Tax=Arundo donax TaxID=35708 RepID=A0A0A8ZPM7_ARUDO